MAASDPVNPIAFLGIAAVLGVLFGSFANVVISRGPRAWGLTLGGNKPSGFAYPSSQCEECDESIRFFDLIPIISWLILRGRCRRCGSMIGFRHLIVEIAGGLIVLVCVWRFGATPHALFAIVWCFGLLMLAVIDAETGYLPDALTWPLALIGLLAAWTGTGPDRMDAVIGGVLGGGSFFLLARGYRLLRGQEGLGGGDVKLMAAAGIWCGPWALPFLVLMASLSGLLFAGAMFLTGRAEASLQHNIRFGPFLAAAAATTYLAPLPFASI